MTRSDSLNYKVLGGFFIIALCTLTFELLISRVMSVVAWYHFAFMAICLALFGMTVGAVIVHKYKDLLFGNFHKSLYFFSLFFSSTLLLNLVIICFCPVFTVLPPSDWNFAYHPLNIFLIFSSIALPLIGSGVIISLVFSKFVRHSNKIYFIDLVGASLGCLLFIPIINFIGVVNSYICLSLLGLFAAFLFNLDDTYSRRKILLAISIALLVFLSVNNKAGLVRLHWAKGRPDNMAFYKKWNSFSYIRLTDWGTNGVPFGWGFAPNKREEIRQIKVDQIHLDIDAMAGTVMTNFENHDTDKIKFLKYDITALPYYFINYGDILVIGIGAGRDILTGILFNQKSITGVEINETILDIHKRLFKNFSGDLSRHPKVAFIHNEARSYINSSSKKFDLIQLSLIDTFAATQAGAYALTENNLYTIEAFETYFQHLTDEGSLSVSYWFHPGNPEAMLRLTGAATLALEKKGITNPREHMVIVHKDGLDDKSGVANLLVKRKAFLPDDIAAVQRYCDEMGFHLILSPTQSSNELFEKMSNSNQIQEFAKSYKFNIAPASDDEPFFFLLTRLNLGKFFSNFKLFDFSAEYILFSLLFIMLILTFIFVILPLFQTTLLVQKTPILAFTIYFIAIGLAFMFIEMSQLTRLSSFLGHPIYGLSIVLFSFLFSSGLGSYFFGRLEKKKEIIFYMGIFMLICLLSVFFTQSALAELCKYPIQLRMIVALITVFPLGLFMGSFIPQGMRMLGEMDGPIALFWGLNGAASVLGSILAMIFQISFGLNMTFLFGTILYGVAIILLLKIKFGNNASVN